MFSAVFLTTVSHTMSIVCVALLRNRTLHVSGLEIVLNDEEQRTVLITFDMDDAATNMQAEEHFCSALLRLKRYDQWSVYRDVNFRASNVASRTIIFFHYSLFLLSDVFGSASMTGCTMMSSTRTGLRYPSDGLRRQHDWRFLSSPSPTHPQSTLLLNMKFRTS